MNENLRKVRVLISPKQERYAERFNSLSIFSFHLTNSPGARYESFWQRGFFLFRVNHKVSTFSLFSSKSTRHLLGSKFVPLRRVDVDVGLQRNSVFRTIKRYFYWIQTQNRYENCHCFLNWIMLIKSVLHWTPTLRTSMSFSKWQRLVIGRLEI